MLCILFYHKFSKTCTTLEHIYALNKMRIALFNNSSFSLSQEKLNVVKVLTDFILIIKLDHHFSKETSLKDSQLTLSLLSISTVLPLIAGTHMAKMHVLADSRGRHKSMDGCQLLIVTVLQNGCCFNILYRFLCNTLTCARQPQARINSAQRILSSSPFVKSQSCFNDA